MSIILRCLDPSLSPITVMEYFTKISNVDDTTGKCLFDAIVDEIKSIRLHFK